MFHSRAILAAVAIPLASHAHAQVSGVAYGDHIQSWWWLLVPLTIAIESPIVHRIMGWHWSYSVLLTLATNFASALIGTAIVVATSLLWEIPLSFIWNWSAALGEITYILGAIGGCALISMLVESLPILWFKKRFAPGDWIQLACVNIISTAMIIYSMDALPKPTWL